jgi:hypothetical protein
MIRIRRGTVPVVYYIVAGGAGTVKLPRGAQDDVAGRTPLRECERRGTVPVRLRRTDAQVPVTRHT